MDILYPYQARFAIALLADVADSLEAEDQPEWFALARAAACIEGLLRGDQPADIDEVSAMLRAIDAPDPQPRRPGARYHAAVNLGIAILDGYRLGLLEVVLDLYRPPRPIAWIGIDLGAGDRTVFHGRAF